MHAIAGPVAPDTFLREAKWALALYHALSAKKLDAQAAKRFVAGEHNGRVPKLQRKAQRQQRISVHALLSQHALKPLDTVYPLVWQSAVGEAVSDAPVKVHEWRPSWSQFGQAGPIEAVARKR